MATAAVSIMSTEVFKVVIAGPGNVGKTSLFRRYMSGRFEPSYTATVGVDMNVATLDFPDGRVVLGIVDLGGQQSFVGLRNRFYQGTHHLILVYDITNRATFDEIPKWFDGITQGACASGRMLLTGSLVANKADMKNKAQVPTSEGEKLAKIMSMSYFEVSAKTGQGVSEMFVHAAVSCRTMHQMLSQH